MHDGSITFSTALDNAQLEKDLARLTKKIQKKEQEVADLRVKRDEGREKSLFDAAALDAEKAKLQEIEDRLADIRAMAKDKSLSPQARDEAKALLPSVQEDLSGQKARVNALQSEWNKLENSIDRYDKSLEEAEAALDRQKEEAGYLQRQIDEADQARADALASAEVADRHIVELNRELLELKARQQELEQAGVGLGYQEYDGVSARIAEINGELKEYAKNLGSASAAVSKAAAGADGMSEAAKRADGYMGRFVGRIKKLASRVFVFTLITSALRTLRNWMGKTIKTNSEAQKSIARLKGALLTLAQPLVEVIIPAFTALVDVLARVVAAIAQLVTALFGGSFQRSKENAENLYDEANAIEGVGAAADKASKQMASFDEINQVGTNDVGGGGGSASAEIAPDFAWMDGADSLFDRFKEIADLVALIGAGLALWKVSELLPGTLGLIAQKLSGLLLTIGGILLYWNGLTDAWENGVDWLDLIEMIGGVAAAALGLYLLLGPIAAGIALIVGGLGMLATGFHDAMENGWSLQNTLLTIAGILAAGLGISLLTGSWIPLLIAGIASVLLALTVATGHGEELIAGIRMVLEGFADFFGGIFSGDMERAAEGIVKIFDGMKLALWAIVDGIRDSFLAFFDWLDEKTNGQFHDIIEAAKGFVNDLFDDMKAILGGFAEFFAGVFTGDMERAAAGIEKIFDGLRGAVSTIIGGIQGLLTAFLDWLDKKTDGQFHDIIEAAKEFVAGFADAAEKTIGSLIDAVELIFTGLIQFLVGVFTGDWELAWEGITNIFKGAWNHAISMLEGAVNLIVSGLNWLIAQINKISFEVPEWVPGIGGESMGFNIPSISEVQIPRLAQGAVIPPNREFLAVLGDQKSGTNIETPLSTMVQAFKQAMREGGHGGDRPITVILQVDRRELGRLVYEVNSEETQRVGVRLTEAKR